MRWLHRRNLYRANNNIGISDSYPLGSSVHVSGEWHYPTFKQLAQVVQKVVSAASSSGASIVFRKLEASV